MMFYILLPLFGWVSRSNGQQFIACDYVQQLEPNKEYWVYNPRYPQYYPSGASCRWVLISDRPIQITCEILDVPPSTKCRADALIIQELDEVTGRRYCGYGNFTILSRTEQLTITFLASPTSSGGHFLCSARAQTTKEEDFNCRCGWKNPTRIVGGQDTGVNEYPMMAALIDVPNNIAYCGATIINERQVLTGANCVLRRNISTLAVLVGGHDLNKGSDMKSSKLYKVQSLVVHDSFNSLTYENDIALVTVQGEIAFSQQVGPACLPFEHAPDTFGGSVVEILGWGLTTPNARNTQILQKAQVPVVTNLICRRDHPAVTAKQICTEAKNGVDSCTFDSGGPVLWQNPTTRRIVEIGIISPGGTCATGQASENTRVGAFIDWIVDRTPTGITYCTME